MSAAAIVGIIVAVLAIGAVAWVIGMQRRRTEALKSLYGPEYSRTVDKVGDQRAAEAELVKRQERVEHFEIRPLLVAQRELFGQKWRGVQAMFVDDPGGAVSQADALVEEVMKTRGYPVADFEQRAADLSVHHARFVENYRLARDVALRHRNGAATTEELRRALVYYRELFQDLLDDRAAAATDRPVERAIERDARRDERAAERVERERTIPTSRDVRP